MSKVSLNQKIKDERANLQEEIDKFNQYLSKDVGTKINTSEPGQIGEAKGAVRGCLARLPHVRQVIYLIES